MFEVDKDDDPEKQGFCIDASVNGNDAQYINHRCDPNCEIEITDGRILVRSLREIPADEEITYDYWIDPDGDDIPCNCGADNCRGFIVREDLGKKITGIITPALEQQGRQLLTYSPTGQLDDALINAAAALTRGLNFTIGIALNKNIRAKLIDPTDVPALAKLDEQCFDDLYYSEQEFREELKAPGFYGLIVHNFENQQVMDPRSAIAYIMGHTDTSEGLASPPPFPLTELTSQGGYLVSCAVKPEFQGNKIYSLLLKAFEALSTTREYSQLRLHTRTVDNPDDNGAWQAFAKTGFEITGTIPDHYDEGDHVYEMVKQLSPIETTK